MSETDQFTSRLFNRISSAVFFGGRHGRRSRGLPARELNVLVTACAKHLLISSGERTSGRLFSGGAATVGQFVRDEAPVRCAGAVEGLDGFVRSKLPVCADAMRVRLEETDGTLDGGSGGFSTTTLLLDAMKAVCSEGLRVVLVA